MPLEPIPPIEVVNSPNDGRIQINTNFESVRTFVNGLEAQIGVNSPALDGLSDRLDIVEGDITNLQTEVGNLETAIQNLTPELPDEFTHNIVGVNVGAGLTVSTTVAIPYNRLYGVYVGLMGLAEGSTVTVRFLGNDSGDIQYISEFTDVLSEDVAQAWRYRDRLSENLLRIEFENTGATAVTFDFEIVAEPF